jgi:hypothetical protein
MSIYKTITLSEKGAKAGPAFNIYWTADGNIFTFLETVILNSIGASVIITLPNNAIAIKLTSIGNCTNSVTNSIPGVTLGDFAIDFNQLDFN